MNLDKIYEINSQQAISETLEGETIIINLENGNYYSLNETGSLIWNYIQSKQSLAQIADYLVSQYDSSAEIVKTAILDLVKSLQDEKLLVETAEAAGSPLKIETKEKKPFTLPKLEKYEDMQEMLLADPIHDVDTAGWPKRKDQK